jgi:SCY1-like protein 1
MPPHLCVAIHGLVPSIVQCDCAECIHPHPLLSARSFGNNGPTPLTRYRAKIVPCVIKLFSSTDRATRISLLRSLHLFIEHLQETLVSEKIFPQLATGFTDSVAAMREETVKAMLLVVPKLTHEIIDNQLLRFFAKLQMDETPSIRVNTTICLGKIAPYLTPESRDRVLASAFVRCLKVECACAVVHLTPPS